MFYSYQPYCYWPLQAKEPWPIRLLVLRPGSPDSPLFCRIEYCALDPRHRLPFEALSYVWGSPDEEQSEIFVIDTLDADHRFPTLKILPSLRAALIRLRHPTADRVLWIDALCINQADPIERSHQVSRMGSIYQNAERVIVWLGGEADESDLAIKFIPQITNLSQLDRIVKDPNSTSQWYALSKIMNRTWFSRRWIVQELAFAQKAVIYCGKGEIEWLAFADAVTLFEQKQQEIVKLFWLSADYNHDAEVFGEVQALGALRLVDAMNRLFRRSESGQILEGLVSLETLVTTLNVFKTQDPRDSIYAVLDLAEDASMMKEVNLHPTAAELSYPNLRVDYKLPFDEVARGFVAFCIKSSNSLDIICRPWAPVPNYYTQYTEPSGTYRLSSWVCTLEDAVFEIREDGHYVRRRGDIFVGAPGRPIYQASKRFPLEYRDSEGYINYAPGHYSYLKMACFPPPDMSRKAPKMEVIAVNIGTITSLGERAMDGTIPSGWFTMADWGVRRDPVPENFYRTLVADRTASGSNIPSWYRRAVDFALTNTGTGDVRLQRLIQQCKSSVTVEVLRRIQCVIWNRKLAISSTGALGLVPAGAEIGDSIMVLLGASVPVILRKLESSYWLIGESYIHGAMDGLTL